MNHFLRLSADIPGKGVVAARPEDDTDAERQRSLECLPREDDTELLEELLHGLKRSPLEVLLDHLHASLRRDFRTGLDAGFFERAAGGDQKREMLRVRLVQVVAERSGEAHAHVDLQLHPDDGVGHAAADHRDCRTNTRDDAGKCGHSAARCGQARVARDDMTSDAILMRALRVHSG